MARRRFHDGRQAGVYINSTTTKGRLEDCEIWANLAAGVEVQKGANVALTRCTIRDHRGVFGHLEYLGSGCGVYIAADAKCEATIGADCVFARNVFGDVVRVLRSRPRRPRRAS